MTSESSCKSFQSLNRKSLIRYNNSCCFCTKTCSLNASKTSAYCLNDFSRTRFWIHRYSTTSSSPPVMMCSSTLRINSASSVCVKNPTEITFLVSSSCKIRSTAFSEKGSLLWMISAVLGPSEPSISRTFTRIASCGSPTVIVFHSVGCVPWNAVATLKDIPDVS